MERIGNKGKRVMDRGKKYVVRGRGEIERERERERE